MKFTVELKLNYEVLINTKYRKIRKYKSIEHLNQYNNIFFSCSFISKIDYIITRYSLNQLFLYKYNKKNQIF